MITELQAHSWKIVEKEILEQGFSILPQAISENQCEEFCSWYPDHSLFRKTINMSRYRFGEGEYKYFQYPLPAVLQNLRTALYEKLAPAANNWARVLQPGISFPASHAEFLEACRQKGQVRPTPLLLVYEKGGHNTLHQDLYGEVYFPFQAVIFLKQVNDDYTGGEFLLVEQRPRAQSRGYSLSPNKGDMIIFATRQRPVPGSRGYYRVQMRHGVSTVHGGSRMTLGMPFHDAS